MILEIDHNSFPMLIKDLKSRKMYTVIKDVMETIDDSLKTENPSITFDKLKDKILEAESNLMKNNETGNKTYLLNDSYSEILESYYDRKNHPEKYKGIDIGLSAIDKATNGFKPSTLNIVVGASGAGKSVILTNWAAEIYKRKYNVLFFSLEMPMTQVISRFISRELCIDYNRFYNGKLTEEEEIILNNKLPGILGKRSDEGILSNDDSFFIINTNFDSPDVSYVEEMVRKYNKMYGHVDVVFVDYLKNMKSKEIVKSGGSEWAHSGACAEGLRNLAANYGLTIFTAQQLNRSGLEKSRKTLSNSPENFEANQEDMSASQNAFHAADSVIAFAPDRENYRMYFKLTKGRDFRFEPFVVNYYPNFNRIIDPLIDDTPFMLSPIAGQLNADHQLPIAEDDSDFGDEF